MPALITTATSNHFLVQSLHILGTERWLQRDCLVEYASQRPNIRFFIVRLILPNLRTGVIRCTGLRLAHALGNFGNIHVPKLYYALLRQENVRTLLYLRRYL